MATAIQSPVPFNAKPYPCRPILCSSDSSSSPSTSPSPASTMMTSTDDELNDDKPQPSLPTPSRKIRFAPLPDPRRDVFVTDDGEELPLSSANSSFPNILANDARTSSPPTPVINISPSSSPSTPTPISPAPPEYSPDPSKSLAQQQNQPAKTWPRSRLFLKPFSRRSTSPEKAPSAFNFSTEEVLTLGTINLFRTSSRDSRRSVDSNQSTTSTLSRWTSNNSLNIKRKKSTASTDETSLRHPARPSSLGGGGGRSQAVGKRMLNGRVYGSKANKKPLNANPFANARDEEPTFVEWGYGGMGSVKNNGGAGGQIAWNKVQSGGTGLHHEEEDDGSGLGWVKKRREERERKAREEKEKENNAPTPAPAPTPPKAEVIDTPSDTTPQAATPTPQREEAHVLSAVKIPARHHRSTSLEGNTLHLNNVTSEKDAAPTDAKLTVIPDISGSSSTSSNSSDSDSDDGERDDDDDADDADDDEDDDNEEEGTRRPTALGAGVEKISRHKDP